MTVVTFVPGTLWGLHVHHLSLVDLILTQYRKTSLLSHSIEDTSAQRGKDHPAPKISKDIT